MKSLTAIYALIVQIRNTLYDRGVFRARELQGPVISVGNLSMGGSGKTPFVILLGELLKKRGVKFDVLSRGYGRRSKDIALVDPNGSPELFGDEPLLIARRLGVPVIVGADRLRAGQFGEKRFGPQLHILDDGFQHRSLARDFDIVMINSEDIKDSLLPKGRLRESFAALNRTDFLVLTNEDVLTGEDLLNMGSGQNKPSWRVHRGIRLQSVPSKPVVFCGIAKPRNFAAQLKSAGIDSAAEKFYRDHHTYTEHDVDNLLRLLQVTKAGGFVTTEKDAINLGRHISKLQPLSVVSVTMELQDADDAVDTMLRIIQDRRRAIREDLL